MFYFHPQIGENNSQVLQSTSELRLGEDVSFVSDIRLRMVFKLSILQLVRGAGLARKFIYKEK